MPGDPLGVAGQLGEQVAVAQDHRVAQQVRDDVDDAGLGHDVPDAPAALVPVDHLVAVPPRRQRLGQQIVDVGPNLGNLGRREDVDGEQMTHLVVPANLGGGEGPRFLDTQRDEPQITIQIGKGIGALRHVHNPTSAGSNCTSGQRREERRALCRAVGTVCPSPDVDAEPRLSAGAFDRLDSRGVSHGGGTVRDVTDPGGGDLFIVDNSISGWTALEYLRQWTDVARSFDIATGFFEIGALLALDGKWQQLDKVRILMGDEVSLRTKNAFKEALEQRRHRLDGSLEDEKDPNPLLEGVEAIIEAIAGGRIECRVYRRDKFHAKAYITHSKFDVIGAQALVGSSNLTRPGLTQNVELNIQIQSGREVAQLQDWFDAHWDAATDVSDEVLHTITRHTAEYSPFDIYAKALHEYFRGRELTAGEWDESRSRMFGQFSTATRRRPTGR